MKAESTIRKTMQRLRKEGKKSNSEERRLMAYDMATALQWIVEDTSWNPTSLLDACCGKNKDGANGSNKKK